MDRYPEPFERIAVIPCNGAITLFFTQRKKSVEKLFETAIKAEALAFIIFQN